MKSRYFSVVIALCLCLVLACASTNQQGKSSDTSQAIFHQTISESRRAINADGVTPVAMAQIQAALANVAALPKLKERADSSQLHGSAAFTSTKLASEGEDGISLFLVRFAPDKPTPVHDHLTWGVVHVLEGRDHYVHWKFESEGMNSDSGTISIVIDTTLEAGGSVYWLEPPDDLHSQEAIAGELWELVIAGKNLLGPIVTDHRHYYDPESGRLTQATPK